MTLTFQNLSTHNKRWSWLLVVMMLVLISTLCGLLTASIGAGTPETLLPAFLSGAAIGSGISACGAAGSYFFGHRLIALMSGARPVEHHEDPVLFNVVEEIAIAAGVPPPKIYVIFDDSPNAFASGRDPQHAIIGITSGLRTKLNRDELQAVIAHEIAHIKNYDIRLMMFVAVFAGIIVLIADFFMRNTVSGFGPGRKRQSNSSRNGGLAVVFLVVAVVFAWIAPVIARLLQLAISREREYLADATAVQFCRNPLALASALKKIAVDPDLLEMDNRATEHLFIMNPDPKRRLNNADRDSIWSTHPPVIKRIAKLRALAGETE